MFGVTGSHYSLRDSISQATVKVQRRGKEVSVDPAAQGVCVYMNVDGDDAYPWRMLYITDSLVSYYKRTGKGVTAGQVILWTHSS